MTYKREIIITKLKKIPSPFTASAIMIMAISLQVLLSIKYPLNINTANLKSFILLNTIFNILAFISIYIYIRVKEYDIKNTFSLEVFNKRELYIIIILFIGICIGKTSLEEMIYSLIPSDSFIEEYSHRHTPDILDALLLLLRALIIAPIYEEFLFRGLIFSSFLNRYGSAIAISVASISFALFHQTADSILRIILFSFILTYLVYKTGSLYSSILVHSLMNLYTLILQQEFSRVGPFSYAGKMIEFFMGIIIIIIGLILLNNVKKSYQKFD